MAYIEKVYHLTIEWLGSELSGARYLPPHPKQDSEIQNSQRGASKKYIYLVLAKLISFPWFHFPLRLYS